MYGTVLPPYCVYCMEVPYHMSQINVTRLIEPTIQIPTHEDDGEERMRDAQMSRKLITSN